MQLTNRQGGNFNLNARTYNQVEPIKNGDYRRDSINWEYFEYLVWWEDIINTYTS